MSDRGFNKKASHSLLSQPAFLGEIQRYSDNIRRDVEYLDCPITAYNIPENNLIKLLEDFEPIESINFYRSKVKDTYSNLIRDFGGEGYSENLHKLIDLDMLLSPFISYPVSDPLKLLFMKPFERLYDDVYLMDESDYERFVQRAYIIYSNFSDILSQGMRFLRSEEIYRLDYGIRQLEEEKATTDLDYWDDDKDILMEHMFERIDSLDNIEKSLGTLIKTSIFYWNLTSSRLDSLCQKLNYGKDHKGSGKYHIFTDNNGIKAIDLETNEDIFSPEDSKEIIGAYFLMDVLLDNIRDPFTYLRPCNVFSEVGLKAETKTYKKLLADFKSRMQ